MTDTLYDTDTVSSTDPCWAEVGLTFRRLNHWSKRGWLRVQRPSYNGWRWPASEIAVAARMVRLVDAGLTPPAAEIAARGSGPVELAPGVWVACSDPEAAP